MKAVARAMEAARSAGGTLWPAAVQGKTEARVENHDPPRRGKAAHDDQIGMCGRGSVGGFRADTESREEQKRQTRDQE